MQRLRGVKAAAATDLFFPDMRLRTPLPGVPLPVSPKKLASHLVKQRRVYQHGLLDFLRGDAEGATKMREAVAGLERVSVPESARAFWWTVGAFFEAIVAGGARSRLRRETARRAARPADSSRRRRLGQGRRRACGARCSTTSP